MFNVPKYTLHECIDGEVKRAPYLTFAVVRSEENGVNGALFRNVFMV